MYWKAEVPSQPIVLASSWFLTDMKFTRQLWFASFSSKLISLFPNLRHSAWKTFFMSFNISCWQFEAARKETAILCNKLTRTRTRQFKQHGNQLHSFVCDRFCFLLFPMYVCLSVCRSACVRTCVVGVHESAHVCVSRVCMSAHVCTCVGRSA